MVVHGPLAHLVASSNEMFLQFFIIFSAKTDGKSNKTSKLICSDFCCNDQVVMQ